MRVAVIGGGLAGLSAAWWIGRPQHVPDATGGSGAPGHRVTLFERQARPGFTAASVSVPTDAGPQRVDVPLRVFYPGYYPTLTRLYDALGVASEPVSYAGSYTDGLGRLQFRYRNLRLGGRSWSWLAPQDLLGPPAARRILPELLRFHRQALAALARGELAGQTIAGFVAAGGYAAEFVDGVLLPTIATICTCSLSQSRAIPAEVVVGYLARGVTRESVRRARQGADDVERRLLAGIAELRCDARIREVRRTKDGVALQMEDGSTECFDQVVLATQARQARALLGDASPAEAAMLAGFSHARVSVITHTDAGFMPQRRRDWSAVNLRLPAGQDNPESTIWLNAVQPALRRAPDIFQTVGPLREPRTGMLIGRVQFERPVVTEQSQQALSMLPGLHAEPGRRLWFCGSWAQSGIPLLESAVRSAAEVAQRLQMQA